MLISDVLSEHEVRRLPPMLFGRVRWKRSLGAPVGDPATGFKVLSEEHTVSEFRISASGPEVIPGTGIWKPAVTVPCFAAPDEGDLHVVAFQVPDVHINGFPDGKYRVRVELTGNWGEPPIQAILGFRRVDPNMYLVALRNDQHIVSLDFDIVQEPRRWQS